MSKKNKKSKSKNTAALLIKDDDVRVSAQQLKVSFLENAAPLVKQYVDAALGTAEFESVSSHAREEVWEILKELMLKSSDKLNLSLQSTKDVLDAVSSGKCTMKEGEELLKLFKQAKDIEIAGLSPNSSTSSGLTININSGDLDQGPEPITVQPQGIE